MILIIPCFNSEKDISRLISSINAQSDKDFMAVFIDCNSSDRTVLNIRKYSAGSSIKTEILYCAKQSSYAARNIALKRFQDDYVIIDCDTELVPNFVQSFKFGFQFYDILFCPIKEVAPYRSLSNFLELDWFGGATKCVGYSQRVIDKIGYFREEYSGDDVRYFAGAKKNFGVGFVPTEITHFHSDTINKYIKKNIKYGKGSASKWYWCFECPFIFVEFLFDGLRCFMGFRSWGLTWARLFTKTCICAGNILKLL